MSILTTINLRRGLPRVTGGQAWPEQTAVSIKNPVLEVNSHATSAAIQDTALSHSQDPGLENTILDLSGNAEQPEQVIVMQKQPLRRGLPRQTGEQHWPLRADTEVQGIMQTESVVEAFRQPVSAALTQEAATKPTPQVQNNAGLEEQQSDVSKETRARLISRSFVKIGIVVIGIIGLAGMAVTFSRWFLGTEVGQSFVSSYPGEYDLPASVPVGFPAWLGWQHFLNVFLMVLIIRSGLQIRNEKRPQAYWTPRRRSDEKVSLTVWFHQSLDILWLLNGAIFIGLLLATGQWMRVVPTSWEVFPNALSAALQYMSLDWPTDNGWVNYNSLQQLAYCTTIFIAAPLAAVTGYRMSGMWPKKFKKLSAVYSIERARKLHFPIMLYFVAFILIHVILVLSTGMLRNLNHMYAAQGSVDATEFATNWLGFWMFVLSLGVIVAASLAARPFILAPLASLFGKVSSR